MSSTPPGKRSRHNRVKSHVASSPLGDTGIARGTTDKPSLGLCASHAIDHVAPLAKSNSMPKSIE